MGRRAGEEGGLSGSGFGISAGVIVTQDKRSGLMLVSGPDGSVHMPPCRVVGAKGRRQESTRPLQVVAGPQAGTPGTFRNRGNASAVHSWRPDRRIGAGTEYMGIWRGLPNDRLGRVPGTDACTKQTAP